jgi:hypothetical protein
MGGVPTGIRSFEDEAAAFTNDINRAPAALSNSPALSATGSGFPGKVGYRASARSRDTAFLRYDRGCVVG